MQDVQPGNGVIIAVLLLGGSGYLEKANVRSIAERGFWET